MTVKTGFLYGMADIEEEILRVLLTGRDIVALITDEKDHVLPATDLRYTRVYPYEYVPETSLATATYVTFDTAVERVENHQVKSVLLYLYAFCHQSLMNVDAASAAKMGISERGPRKKILGAKIDEAIGGMVNTDWIGRVELVKTDVFTPAKEYYGDCLVYRLLDVNIPTTRLYE